jgi:hypothetical protein
VWQLLILIAWKVNNYIIWWLNRNIQIILFDNPSSAIAQSIIKLIRHGRTKECFVQRRYLSFVKLCFDNIMSNIMKVSYMKSNKYIYCTSAEISLNYCWKYILDKFHFFKSPKTFRVIITIILCCPCYMPKYVPRLEGIIHSPFGSCIMPSNLEIFNFNNNNELSNI